MFQEFSDWLTSPLRGQVPLWTLALIVAAWIILICVVWQLLAVAKSLGAEVVSDIIPT